MEGSIYKGYKKTFRSNRQVYYFNYHDGFTLSRSKFIKSGSLNMSNLLYINYTSRNLGSPTSKLVPLTTRAYSFKYYKKSYLEKAD